ncbi:MAG: 8-amino-7-oxononanoate synthase, partial [Muribaculaceae bacterium]|nr:8-amino-7-oxononanoate synthase [Muribaculaceae bacterium]
MIYDDILSSLKEENRLRSIPDGLGGLDLISNDYMSLGARYSQLCGIFFDRYGETPMTASASRLLQRNQKEHNALEKMLSKLYGKSILLMNSGYHANTGALSA